MSTPIYLCGFMGVGKSTIGQILAKKMGCAFLDTDDIVTLTAKKSIPQIFSESGEPGFRKYEMKALAYAAKQKAGVIALGGWALSLRENLQFVQSNGCLVYLVANLDSLMERLQTSASERPLLGGLNEVEKKNRISDLLSEREVVYRQAEIQVRTDDRTPNEIAEEIVEEFQRYIRAQGRRLS